MGEGETISSRSSRQLVSTVVKSCHGQPSATTGELLSVGGRRRKGEREREGDGPPSLPLPPFSLSLLGNRDEWASWGGFRPAESCAPCARSCSTSGKNSIPRLKGMTRSSGPYSRPGNFHENQSFPPSLSLFNLLLPSSSHVVVVSHGPFDRLPHVPPDTTDQKPAPPRIFPPTSRYALV